jgi:metallophosphoesterase superfamily enzyme
MAARCAAVVHGIFLFFPAWKTGQYFIIPGFLFFASGNKLADH